MNAEIKPGTRRAGRAEEPPAERSEIALSTRNLTKTYGDGDSRTTAVDNLNLTIERGTVVGLLGPNGAGKTTTIKMLLGLIRPDAGSIDIGGVDPNESPHEAYQFASGMLEGARNVYWRLTVRENLRFFARIADRSVDAERIDSLIEQVGLTEKADTPVNSLSRGMKQKASLASTLARETPIAFLDEPTLGLDVESSLELRSQLRRMAEAESRTVVISSHDMDVIEAVCDRVIIMNEGRVVADDTLESLIDIFRTQSYEITVDGELPTTARSRLETEFGATEWTTHTGKLRFEATRVQQDEFYDLMDLIRNTDCSLVRVSALEPDLEDIFLHVTADSEETDL